MVAAAVIGAGVLGAGTSLIGSSEAASGAKAANATNQAAINYQEGSTSGFVNVGNLTANNLYNELMSGQLGQTPDPTNAQLANMPGYQFTQQQGLLATQNAAAAQGLGVSGNALAAASQYATNLAATNYQQYFNDYWANQNNRYNQLMGVAQLGENAAVGSGSNVASSSAAAGQAQQAAGQSAAAGTSGAGSSISNALLANALLGNQTGSTISPSSAIAAQGASELPSSGFLGASY